MYLVHPGRFSGAAEKTRQIGTDGRGRALDNVFVERLWSSLRDERIYPGGFASGAEWTPAPDRHFRFYNHRRPHAGRSVRANKKTSSP
jgi:transposase InsO family protein